MAGATQTPKTPLPIPKIGGCGSCTYTYNQQDGCYHRQGLGGCTRPCSCSPLICGLGSLVLQVLRPDTVTSSAAVSLTCLTATNDEEWIAKALHEFIAGKTSPATFWQRVCIGLGVLCVLLAIGLAIAMVYR